MTRLSNRTMAGAGSSRPRRTALPLAPGSRLPLSTGCHRQGPAGLEILFKVWLLHFFREIQHLVQLIHYSFQLLFAMSRPEH